MICRSLFFGLCTQAMATAHATDWETDVDLRLVSSDGLKTVQQGGLGTLRYDDGQSGLRLGRARFALAQPLGEVWSLHLDASAWGEPDKNPVDLTEAYFQFRPYPRDGLRLRMKAGAFYAPISLENRASGWESPYTLSYSAINTWLAQEVRTIGVEGQLDWLGTRMGHGFDAGLVAGVQGWNDVAGATVATRGFSLSDRQTTLFGRVGATDSALSPIQPFREIGGNAGFYGGVEVRYFDRIVVRALHYDNGAIGDAYDPAIHESSWDTNFNSAGLRAEGNAGWTLIAQYLNGKTYTAPAGTDLRWQFHARYALLSKELARHHRLSLRYDTFRVVSDLLTNAGAENGHAWTAAYVYEATAHWKLTLEALRVDSNDANRLLKLGQPTYAQERQVQLAVRYTLGSLIY